MGREAMEQGSVRRSVFGDENVDAEIRKHVRELLEEALSLMNDHTRIERVEGEGMR